MTPGARIQSAIELLDQILMVRTPADRVIADYFRQRRYAGGKDRYAIQLLTYGLLRRYAWLGWMLGQNNMAKPDARTRMLAYLSLGDHGIPGEINELFDGGPHRPAPLSPSEKKLFHNLHGKLQSVPPAWIRVETPDWLYEAMAAAFGQRTDDVLMSLNQPAETDLRVNLLKADRDSVLTLLAQSNIEARPTRWSPWGIRIKGHPHLAALPMFRDGLIEVQDEGSQLVALLVDARAGHRVADFCAGAGGKTLAMAAAMQNRGHIVATDVLAGRIQRSSIRLQRAGVHNTERRALIHEKDPWVKRHSRKFDRVLVDAPCLGVGTWRRNPDARWKIQPADLPELTALQASILQSAARLVKPGGRLIYATCSLLSEENTQQIDRFLSMHPDYALLPYQTVWQALTSAPLPCEGPFLALTPLDHGTDGFFCAIMTRAISAKPTDDEKAA